MSTVTASFAVYAGTTITIELDAEGMTDAEIVAAVRDAAEDEIDTRLCHECAHRIADPQAEELTGLDVDGREIDLDAVGGEQHG